MKIKDFNIKLNIIFVKNKKKVMHKLVAQIEKSLLTPNVNINQVSVGDTVAVHCKIVEGEKERTQIFQGTVIQIKGRGLNKTFTVRKISVNQIGVERIFPISSPFVLKVEVLKKGKVRRSRIFYLRNLSGKNTKLKEIIGGNEVNSSEQKDNKKIETKEDFTEVEKVENVSNE